MHHINHDGKGGTVKYELRAEVWKFINNRETKVNADTLLSWVGRDWLEMVKAEDAEAKEQKGVDELKRMFRLEDPRG